MLDVRLVTEGAQDRERDEHAECCSEFLRHGPDADDFAFAARSCPQLLVVDDVRLHCRRQGQGRPEADARQDDEDGIGLAVALAEEEHARERQGVDRRRDDPRPLLADALGQPNPHREQHDSGDEVEKQKCLYVRIADHVLDVVRDQRRREVRADGGDRVTREKDHEWAVARQAPDISERIHAREGLRAIRCPLAHEARAEQAGDHDEWRIGQGDRSELRALRFGVIAKAEHRINDRW